jgi:hypothetical protein
MNLLRAALRGLAPHKLQPRKETRLSEPLNQDASAPIAASVPSSVDPVKVVSSVVQTVQAHPAVAPAAAPSVIATILAGLYQAEPAIFAVTRASSQTAAAVSLGVGLAEVIVAAFLHPAA